MGCSGNGLCRDGVCVCGLGFGGLDCATSTAPNAVRPSTPSRMLPRARRHALRTRCIPLPPATLHCRCLRIADSGCVILYPHVRRLNAPSKY